jgi:hypothetical protein
VTFDGARPFDQGAYGCSEMISIGYECRRADRASHRDGPVSGKLRQAPAGGLEEPGLRPDTGLLAADDHLLIGIVAYFLAQPFFGLW